MSDPDAGDAQASKPWPCFPVPARRIEHADALLGLAGDGHREFILIIPFFLLGFVVAITIVESLGLPVWLAIAGPLLGVWVGKRVNRAGLAAVLRDGVEARGEIVKIIEGGKRPAFIYHYVVDGKESRHDVTNQGPEIDGKLKIGMPVLVIHDRRRIGRHLAFFPPRFAEVRQLLGEQIVPTAGVAPAISSTPYRDDLSAPRRQLPFAPRSLPADARQILGLGWSTRHLVLSITIGLLMLGLVFVAWQGLVELTAPVLWIPGLFLLYNLLFATLGWGWLTRALLRRGVETTGTITAIDPHGGQLRVGLRHAVGDATRDWSVLVKPNAIAVAVGDSVPVLYSAGTLWSWLCVSFVTHEAQALLERWNAERPA